MNIHSISLLTCIKIEVQDLTVCIVANAVRLTVKVCSDLKIMLRRFAGEVT